MTSSIEHEKNADLYLKAAFECYAKGDMKKAELLSQMANTSALLATLRFNVLKSL